MADISVEKKKSGDFTWIWALIAVAAVGGLMIWLASTQETITQVATTGADTAPAGASAAVATPVDLPTLGAAPESFSGQRVRVSNATVAAVLGNRAFWADVPGANPFLVVLGPAVADVTWLAAGATTTLEGVVGPVVEADLDQWVQGQSIRPEARDEASFASHYLNAEQVVQ